MTISIRNRGCVQIDGVPLHRVREIDFHQDIDSEPSFHFDLVGIPDIEIIGNAEIDFGVVTLEQAALVLKNAFRKNEDFRKAIIETVESALYEGGYKEESEDGRSAEKVARWIFDG